MPWSVKAQELLRQQYAPAGSAGVHVLPVAKQALEQARDRVEGIGELLSLSLTDARLDALISTGILIGGIVGWFLPLPT